MTGTRRPSCCRLAPALALAVATVLAPVGAPSEVRRGSVSVGQPNAGRLVRGVRLPDRGPGYLSVPSGRPREPKYGTEELVEAVTRAGADVSRRAPGAVLHVGDLSVDGGGPAPGHESHQAGRDVDLLFFALDAGGEAARPEAVRFDGRGIGTLASGEAAPGPVRVFDARRNWLVLRSLIENEAAHLQRVLVSEPLRALLLDHAERAGEPGWVIERASEVMCDTWSPHDNHFHVRLFCTAEDLREGCRDEHPFYPWRRTELAGLGILTLEVAEDPNRRRGRARRWLASRPGGRQWCP